jgi:RNA 3'-terminal phosphate cyclase (ATP)
MLPVESTTDIEIDGSLGEGGGQVLRTAISLSGITGKSVRIFNIRKGRSTPGLQKQHIISVLAACQICNGELQGCIKDSMEIKFFPKEIKGGTYVFDIASAGSSILVLQTVVPILWFAEGISTVTVKGGTHNGMSPSADFYRDVFCPLLPIKTDCVIEKFGFYPAGGGQVSVTIDPHMRRVDPILIIDKGDLVSKKYIMTFCKTIDVANQINKYLGFYRCDYNEVKAIGKGLPVLSAKFIHTNITEIITVYHEKKSKNTDEEFTNLVSEYDTAIAPVDEHLADQLLLPLALISGGIYKAISISKYSKHFETNVAVIHTFLGQTIFTKDTPEGIEVRIITDKVIN